MLGLVFGALAIRHQGIYFSMITLALAQMVFFFPRQAKFTGGEDGIQAVPRGYLFVVCVLVFRKGILGLVARMLKRPPFVSPDARRARRPPVRSPAAASGRIAGRSGVRER